ncbi:hypothetical protein T439DRAFT_382625 [Meredithblackwellia eburnea MCA 4105]
MAEAKFDRTAENKIGRNEAKNGSYDKQLAIDIFKAAPVVHVAFNTDDGSPQCMPMMGTIEWVKEEDEVYIYLHGSAASRFIKTNQEEGASLCITASIFDGYIFGLTPFSHSAKFRSVVFHGTTFPFDSDLASSDELDKEKLHAMSLLINSIAEGRWEQTRPPSKAELNATGVIRIRVSSGSVKRYNGDVGTNIADDLANSELKSKIWTGVIPIRTVALPLEPWGINEVHGDAIPSNIANFTDDFAKRSLAGIQEEKKTI